VPTVLLYRAQVIRYTSLLIIKFRQEIAVNYAGTHVGIWGFGTTGKSLLSFFKEQKAVIGIFDSRILTLEEQLLTQKSQATLYAPDSLASFLHTHEIIVPSPGVDIAPFRSAIKLLLPEIDIFCHYFRKPLIAVTGSSGKTSIVTLLQQLLTLHGSHIPAIGNIGTPMLSFLDRSDIDGAVMELSSFQLEYSTQCAPDLAIWTNLYENHLDRHKTMAHYCAAKCAMLYPQRSGQCALLPLSLYPLLPQSVSAREGYAYFSPQKPSLELSRLISSQQSLYFLDENKIMVWKENRKQSLLTITPSMITITYSENWLILAAALHMLSIPLSLFDTALSSLKVPEHRLELVDTVHGVHFYNDSKSTIPESTLAAVNRLQPSPIILLLGGVSKGIDRQELIKQLTGKVRAIACFGKEADQLYRWCIQYGITATQHQMLEDAFNTCIKNAHNNDVVLLSPAGTSYDLFANYMQRGVLFKELVAMYSRS
jgi:UDP-N-acetylmuramoylalanine--D-glutamate ligase